jgi:uncharacterized protein
MAQRDDQVEHDGLIPALVRSVTRTVSRRPAGVLWLVGLSVLLSVGITARFLTFKTDRSDLIDTSSAFQQRWLNYIDAFGDKADAVVVVEAADSDIIRTVLDDLGPRVAQEDLFDRVVWRFDPSSLRSKALQFLSPRELETCMGRLDRYREVLRGNWDDAGLQATAGRLARELRSSDRATAEYAARQSLQLVDSLQGTMDGDPFRTPWLSCLNVSEPAATTFAPVYQISEQGTMGFLLAVPLDGGSDFRGTSRSIDRLRELIDETQRRYDGVQIGLTGIPVLESDEMRRSQTDMTLASAVSFLGVGTLLMIGFRGLRHPLLAMLMLLVGLAWSFGFATLFVGHLNILSVSFAAVLVGLGIDFAIHYLARYLELRHQNVLLRPALRQTSWGVGTGIVTAAVTTALAFFCATLTSFLGVAELGIIAGGGILLCCVTTFLVLPAMIAIADRNVEPRRLPTPFRGLLLKRITSTYPGIVTCSTLLALGVISCFALSLSGGQPGFRVRYDANLLNLQASGVESVAVQSRIFQESQGSLLYAVSIADGPAEVRQRRREFEQLETVAHVEDLASHMPRFGFQETGLLVQGIHSRLSHVSDFPRQFPRLNPRAVGLALEDLLDASRRSALPAAQAAGRQLDQILDRFTEGTLEQQLELLTGYQYAMLAALKGELEAIAAISDPTPVSPADFPESVRERFVSPGGQWLLRVYPAFQVWDEQPLARFVSDVRSVDPEATGTPLQNYEAAGQIRDSYFNAALYAFIVIWLVLLVDTVGRGPLLVGLIAPLALIGLAVLLLPYPYSLLTPMQTIGLYLAMVTAGAAIFDFSSVRNTFLTLLPPVGGGAMMFGILAMLGIDLNPANLIVLPLILGIGVDDGVHVIHDFRMQPPGRYRTSSSTINAIMLTSLTSMIGFGSMMLAAHRGLASLGLVLVIGVGSCLFVSLVTLPAILTLVSRRSGGSEIDRFAPPDGVEAADPGSESETQDQEQAAIVPFKVQRRRAV